MNITSRFDHYNINVFDLDRSLAFYRDALGLTEVRRKVAEDGSLSSFIWAMVLPDFRSNFTWLRDWDRPYNMGDNEQHLCVRVQGNYDSIRAYHKEMGCVCYENHDMGLYFINDPDGYWIEILPLQN